MGDTTVSELKRLFGGVKSIPVKAAEKLGRILDRAGEEALVALVRERVRFCDRPAMTRLYTHFGWSWERIEALRAPGKEVAS